MVLVDGRPYCVPFNKILFYKKIKLHCVGPTVTSFTYYNDMLFFNWIEIKYQKL